MDAHVFWLFQLFKFFAYTGDDNDSSIIGTECPSANDTDDDSGPVGIK